jgi:uncharacterized cupin superfamily protein
MDNDKTMRRRPAVAALDVATESGCSYPEPFASRVGSAHWRPLGDHFGLTRFGISLETLAPGAQTGLRHWHTLNDEFVYMLDGELILRTDEGETAFIPGMCAGFKAGARNAHHFVNRSDRPAHYLILGSRLPGDSCFYPDDDLMWIDSEHGRYAAHKDGTRY